MLLHIDDHSAHSDHSAYCYTGGKPFDAALPTVVFIHGAQNDHSVWILQTRYFAHHGFNVLAVDLPGHGRSKGAALTSVEAMADWVLRLLDKAGVAQASLVGHSMGSLIALETQARAPARITRLALVGTSYPMKVSDALLNAALHDEQQAIDMVNIWSHSSIAQKPSFPGPGFYVTGGSQRLMQYVSRHSSEKVFHIDFSACNAYTNGEAAAKAVTCPTLFLMGKRDIMTPPRATATLTKAIPAARIVQLENCGHALMAEQPDAVLDCLFSFMQGQGGKD
jgi:pimeloyl-ACP methyl ester carboxylesterase